MSVLFLLTALDSVLEPLLVFVRALHLYLGYVLAVHARVDDLLVDLRRVLLDGFVQIHRRFGRQE